MSYHTLCSIPFFYDLATFPLEAMDQVEIPALIHSLSPSHGWGCHSRHLSLIDAVVAVQRLLENSECLPHQVWIRVSRQKKRVTYLSIADPVYAHLSTIVEYELIADLT